jgi:hypothetical protein
VTDADHCWWSNTANPDVWVCGANSDLSANPGDSGSPIYYTWLGTEGQPYLAAVGILDTATGNFARIDQALSPLGFTVYTPCGGTCE